MSATKPLKDIPMSIRAKILEYRTACEAHAFIGAAQIEDRDGITLDLAEAFRNLEEAISEIADAKRIAELEAENGHLVDKLDAAQQAPEERMSDAKLGFNTSQLVTEDSLPAWSVTVNKR